MADIAANEWQKEIEEARTALKARFPELRCLRCGVDNFAIRLFRDESLSPGFQSDRVVELICDNCGFQGKRVVQLLTSADSN